jgi:hypothetical protein
MSPRGNERQQSGSTLLPPLQPATSSQGASSSRLPHTARNPNRKNVETAAAHRKREQQVQREALEKALRNLATSKQADAQVVRSVLAQLAAAETASTNKIDFAGFKAPVDLQLLFVLEAALSNYPCVTEFDIGNVAIDAVTCGALANTIQRTPQVLSIAGVETCKLCGGNETKAAAMEEALLRACMVNRKRHDDEQADRKRRKQEARQARRDKKAETRQQEEVPAFKRRVYMATEMLVSHLVLSQKTMRAHLTLLERERFGRIRAWQREQAKQLAEHLHRQERYREALRQLSQRENAMREDLAAESVREHASVLKTERDGRRKIAAADMARAKKLEIEREVFERKEKAARSENRSEEDEHRQSIFREGRAAHAKLQATEDQIRAERELERRRVETEHKKAEKERLDELRRSEEEKKRITDQLELLEKREKNIRDNDIPNAEMKGFWQVTMEFKEGLRRVQALDAKRHRTALRTQHSTVPLSVSFDNWRPQVPFCTGSDAPVRVADLDAKIRVDPNAPDFMAALVEGFRPSNRLGTPETPVVPKVKLEADEMPSTEWLKQKLRALGCKITVTIDPDLCDPSDTLVFDSPTWRVDKSTGVIKQIPGGEVIGLLTPSYAVTRPPKAPPVRPDTPHIEASFSETVKTSPPAADTAEQQPSTTQRASPSGARDPDALNSDGRSMAIVPEEDVLPTTEISVYVPFNADVECDPAKLLMRVVSCIGFIRTTESQDEVPGEIVMELYSLVPTDTVGHGGDVCIDLNEHPEDNCDNEGFDRRAARKTATAASVLDRVMPDAFGYAYNTSESRRPFAITIHRSLIQVAPEIKYATFHEGQAELIIFPSIASGTKPGVEIDCPVSSLADCVLSLDMGPLVQQNDVLWPAAASTVRVHQGIVTIDSVAIAVISTRGVLVPQSDDDAFAGMPTATEMVLSSACHTKHLQALLANITFKNPSRNPTDVPRYVRVGLSVPSLRLYSTASVGIRFETVDDLTVVDFGAGGVHVTYHQDVAVPAPLKDYVQPDPFYFGSFCDVFDVDTTAFSGGSLLLRIMDPEASDTLKLVPGNPLVDVAFAVTPDGLVAVDDIANAQLEPSDNWEVRMTLLDTSIEHVAAFVRSVVFRTLQNPALFGGTPTRHLECILVVADAPPVRALCDVRVAMPLLLVPTSYASVTYQENGGAVRLCPIDASLDDEGWDGGYLYARFLSGCTADDRIGLREDEEVQLTDAPNGQNVPIRSMTQQRLPTNTRKRLREALLKRRRDMAVRRAALRAKFDALRRKTIDMDDSKAKVLWHNGKRIGIAYLKPSAIFVALDEKLNLDEDTRSGMCSIHRNSIAAVLKRLTFENVSDDPQELQKVVLVSANDGLPHVTTAAIQITVQTQDDVTEIHRVSAAPKEFRSLSEPDKDGYCLFDDCTVYDPDTFAFNGGLLHVDLVGGGDPKGDQLGVLNADEQKRRDPQAPVVEVTEGDKVSINGKLIGTLALDVSNPEGTSNLRFAFAPMPAGYSRPTSSESHDRAGANAGPTIKSHEEAALVDGIVTIKDVQRCLHVVTYTNKAAKVKAGARVYQVRVGFDGFDGRTKLTLNVSAPMLWNPDFGAEVTYRENQAPTAFLPKIVVNMPEKQIIKDGTITITVETDDPHDVLSIDGRKLTDGVAMSKDRDKITIGGKDFGAKLKITHNVIAIAFDYSSKLTVKQVINILRSATFANTSDSPLETPRTVWVDYRGGSGELHGQLTARITILTEDDPTEITFQQPLAAVARLSPLTLLAPDAIVSDPDTTSFDHTTTILAELKGGIAESDHLLLLGRGGIIEGEIHKSSLDPKLAMAPAPPPGPYGGSAGRRASIAPPEMAKSLRGRRASVVRGPSETAIFEEVAGESPVIATFTRVNNYTIKITITQCTIGELQHIVRSIAARFDLNAKDRTSRKTLHIELKSGSAASRAKLPVDVLPPLIEPPTTERPAFVAYGAAPVEVMPYHVAPSSHYSDGASIDFKHAEKAAGCQFALLPKYGVTLKGATSPYELHAEGKKIGTMNEPADKSAMTVHVGKGFGTHVNKVIKSVGMQALSSVQASGRETLDIAVHAVEATTNVTQSLKVTVMLGSAMDLQGASRQHSHVSGAPPDGVKARRRKQSDSGESKADKAGAAKPAGSGKPAPKKK